MRVAFPELCSVVDQGFIGSSLYLGFLFEETGAIGGF